ncbi:MAG: cytochrome c [Thermoleophilia bacterium]|nr:cytochrome c [Thermoleophilia bacterium]
MAVYVAAVAGTGRSAEKPTDGRSIFVASCGSCHTLADAGTSGTVGPSLDDARPSKEAVATIVTNGRGAMPSFRDSLDPQQIEAVAEYVSSVAGK